MDAEFLNETRLRLADFFMPETRLNSIILGETESLSVFFTRPRQEPTYYKEKTLYLAKFC